MDHRRHLLQIDRLRAALSADSLGSEASGSVLTVKPDAVDALRFQSLVERAQAASPAQAAALLREGLRLWRGPAFAELSDLNFATVEAARLEGMRLDAIEDLAAVLVVEAR